MGGELSLPGFSVCPISGLLGITWHKGARLQPRMPPCFPAGLGHQGLWDSPLEAQGGCFFHSCFREKPELLSLRALSQIAMVGSGWQVQQLQRNWMDLVTSACLEPSA